MQEHRSNRRFGRWGSDLDRRNTILNSKDKADSRTCGNSVIPRKAWIKIFRIYFTIKSFIYSIFNRQNT